MKPLPKTVNALVLRTDFSDQSAGAAICETILKPVGIFRFRANVEFLDDMQYADLNKDPLLTLASPHYNHSFIVVVDQMAISQPDHPLLVVYMYEGSGKAFRGIPSQIQGIENNLSIANMDFEEFAESVDEDGVFRGFPES
jgi:hypothetical protein